ncbi:MAG TPA: dethiobiotin synthase [Microcoleaceae cyanobacterium]
MNALLIAGTDTDAGKTILTTALAAYWSRYHSLSQLGILKPIQSGIGDRETYSRLFNLDPNEVNPLWFEAPLAPPLAADREGRRIELERVWQAFETLRQQKEFVLVESLGGLGSPVTHDTTVADLAWDWRLPTVLVVPVKLGAIGQAVANVALARQSRIHLKGIVLNCAQPRDEQQIADWAPANLIQRLTNVPVLGLIPYLADCSDLDKLAQVAANLELERLLPIASRIS